MGELYSILTGQRMDSGKLLGPNSLLGHEGVDFETFGLLTPRMIQDLGAWQPCQSVLWKVGAAR